MTLSIEATTLSLRDMNSTSCAGEENSEAYNCHFATGEADPDLWSFVVLAKLRLRECSDVVPHLLPGCYGKFHQPLMKEGREGREGGRRGREGGRKGGREERREGGKEGGRKGEREGGSEWREGVKWREGMRKGGRKKAEREVERKITGQ